MRQALFFIRFITCVVINSQQLYKSNRAYISCLIKSGFRAWKLVNPMAQFNSLNEVSIPHLK